MRKIAILGACILAAFAANAQQDEVKELFLSGKANYAEYDDLLGKKAFGKLPEGGEVQMANLLLQGYETFNKVLPLDSLPNAKGKVKPKYSKEIHNTVAGHYTDYNNAAIAYWEAKDYDKAYQAWELFCTIPEKFKVANVPADTVMGEIRYNQALAAWQNGHFARPSSPSSRPRASATTKRTSTTTPSPLPRRPRTTTPSMSSPRKHRPSMARKTPTTSAT